MYYLRFTGKPEEKKRWMGPVIGAYRVASTREEVPEAEPAKEVEAKPTGTTRVSESSLEERLAEKRRLRAERRKKRLQESEKAKTGEDKEAAEEDRLANRGI